MTEKGIIGRSWLGEEIGYVKIGTGIKKVLLIGGFSAVDGISSAVLSDWTEKACESYEKNKNFGEFRAASLFAKTTVFIINNINPDGKKFANGPDVFNPFYGRAQSIRKNYPDRHWTANARGTELSKNFAGKWMEAKMAERSENTFTPAPSGYGGEYPESELATSSLCGFIRKTEPDFICIFTDEKKGIYIDKCIDTSANIQQKAMLISKLKNFPLKERTSKESAATLPVWVKKELDIPSFTVGLAEAECDLCIDTVTLCAAL